MRRLLIIIIVLLILFTLSCERRYYEHSYNVVEFESNITSQHRIEFAITNICKDKLEVIWYNYNDSPYKIKEVAIYPFECSCTLYKYNGDLKELTDINDCIKVRIGDILLTSDYLIYISSVNCVNIIGLVKGDFQYDSRSEEERSEG